MRNLKTAPPAVRPAAARIGRLHAAMAGIMHELLTELAEFDAGEVWRADGATDMVSWLTYELGLLPRNARAWLEVARSLDELPELRRRLASGELSLDQVRPLCKLATPDDERDLAEMAGDMTAAELERLARRARHIPKEQLVEDEPHRVLRWWWEPDERFVHLAGKLPAAEGAVVERALSRIAAEERVDARGIPFRPAEERAADALVVMAGEVLERRGESHRPTVVVHVSAEHLATGQGSAVMEHGPVLAIESARRLACDANWLVTVDGPDGAPIGVGRRSRRIPAWLSRLVNERDEGCRFPGCGRTTWTHAHHIVHWANGGPTDLDNLVTLCGFHHRMVHNEGWQIRGNPNGQIDWVHPCGRVHEPARRLPTAEWPEPSRLADIDARYRRRHAIGS